jgi:tetratricopeptide (TPR) repeat protein
MFARCLFASLIFSASPSFSQTENERYAECAKLATSAPHVALKDSTEWVKTSSSLAAKHCHALALYGVGRYAEAATLLDGLATELRIKNLELWIKVSSQSARAWDRAGNAVKSIEVYSQVIDYLVSTESESKATDVIIEKAIVYENMGRIMDALQTLDHALEIDPNSVNALTVRTRIYGKIGKTQF